MSDFYAGVLTGVFATLAAPPLILAAGWSVWWAADRWRTRKAVKGVIEDSRRWCDANAKEETA